jgi:hypothetical protein
MTLDQPNSVAMPPWVSNASAMPIGHATSMKPRAVMVSLPKNQSVTILVRIRLKMVPPTPVSRRPR